MIDHARVAHFLLLGQTAARTVRELPELAPVQSIWLSPSYDLAPLMPDVVRAALRAADAYKLFFVFETYLRDLVLDVLSQDASRNWFDNVPPHIQDDVRRLEQTEEVKAWMGTESRDKSALLTLPQLLAIIDANWNGGFEDVVRDKALLQNARAIAHLRNTICHMTPIPDEEIARVRQTMRDWFRMVAP